MADDRYPDQQPVRIEPPGLEGFFGMTLPAKGVVVFAHGSGSGRLSPRNNHVAAELRTHGIATLLLDLLRPAEEQDRRNVFDIPLLASRLLDATDWISRQPHTMALPIGYFGASTGAAAALMAAADPSHRISAVVSRGGRPDLAMDALADVRAPTLLIVGGDDEPVIEFNRMALERLASSQLEIIRGAGHLFEEPGKLDEVVARAAGWFTRWFAEADRPEAPDAGERHPLR